MKKLLLFTTLLIVSFINAQTIWQPSNQLQLDKITDDLKVIKPSHYEVIDIDAQALSDKLENAVDRFSGGSAILVDFPISQDHFETFKVYTSGAVSEGFNAQYPEIQSFFGYSKTDSLNKIYFTITPQGFRGLITGSRILYMDPYSKATPNSIMIYDRQDLSRASDDKFECHTIDQVDESLISQFDSGIATKAFRDRTFRTYRIAIAATAEYTAYHDDGNAANGNAVADALAGIVTTLTRVNSVFEQEMSMRFSLVANNDQVIFTNSTIDPYDNYSGNAMLGQNVSTLQSVIGSSKYDIGHVFSTGGGGIAGTSPCSSGKERGVTGIVTPEFDPFDVDYVCHEIGHQFGASHTFYNGCFGGSPSSSPYESGSASTIMGYAGICAPNVQDNSDAYFHLISLFQMQNSIDADTCEVETALTSLNPSAPDPVSPGDKTIPKSTPFKLTSTSSVAPDAGETYTYNWEQLDTGNAANTGATQPPVSTNTTGPMFRSKFATTSPTRYFPNLPDLINNVDPTWEELSSVSRDMRFFCTIRDNNPNGGQTDFAGTVITVGSAGPFVLNAPNGNELWHEGESETITWSVNGTNTNTYSTTVNIKLSLDGGFTYPLTLASNTNNDGSQLVTIPVGAKTSQARVMVEASNNYFFDITNNNFEIKESTFELTAVSDAVTTCQPSNASFSFTYNAAPGFTETTSFTALGLPAGLNASFSPSTSNSDTQVTVTISGTETVTAGQFDFSVQASASSATILSDFYLKIFDNTVGSLVQTSPINGAGNQIANPLLVWDDLASASEYLVEVSEFSDFSIITETSVVNNQNSYQPSLLIHSKIYYWRVTPSNDCVSGNLSSISAFQTAQDVCMTYDNETYENTAQNASNQNKWNTSVNAVAAKVIVTDDIEVTNLSFYMNASHNDTGHIKMQLSAPTGRFAEVYNRECASGQNFDLIVSDNGTQSFGCSSGYTGALTGNQRPGQAFTRFNNASALGEWVLLATDRDAGTGGTFNEFSVTVCGRLQYVNDIDNNRNLGITTSFNAANIINQTSLRSVQSGFTNANLIYVVTNDVDFGQIQLNGVDLNVGDTFTQGDIDSDSIQYVHDSLELINADSFDYTVLGDSNTLLEGQTFNIIIEDPILIYDAGSWTPFAPDAETASIDAQVLSGVAPVVTGSMIKNISIIGAMSSLNIVNDFTIYGDITIEGTITASEATLILQGSNSQVVSGVGVLELDTLEVNNTNGVTFNSVTNIYKVLKPNSSILNTNNNVVFKSNPTTTGQLDNAAFATINGAVKVERYVPGKRAFRFLASSVNSTHSIRENWQENGAAITGLGTHITGPSTANGFDTTTTGAYSLFTFDNDNYAWSVVPNTNVQQLTIGMPLRMLVRGDRTVDLANNSAIPSGTTLRSSGTVYTGDFVRSYATDNGEYAMISNPYQAAVDFKSVLDDVATSGFNGNFIYVWDPTLNSRGGYATVDMSFGNGFAVPTSSNANKFLQPGQSVFVATTGASGLTFRETNKALDQSLTDVFGTYNQGSQIRIALHNTRGNTLLDQVILQFDNGYSDIISMEDAIKFDNLDETLAIKNGVNNLSIEKRQLPIAGDVTLLHLSNYRESSYVMNVEVSLNASLVATLVDQETNTRTILQDGNNSIAFQVTAAGSVDSRFFIEYATSTLSLEEGLLNDISVFPNPVTNNSFQMSSSYLLGKEVEINLYTTLGQRVYENTTMFNGTQAIKPSTILSSGMYILKVTSGDQTAIIELIVQ